MKYRNFKIIFTKYSQGVYHPPWRLSPVSPIFIVILDLNFHLSEKKGHYFNNKKILLKKLK